MSIPVTSQYDAEVIRPLRDGVLPSFELQSVVFARVIHGMKNMPFTFLFEASPFFTPFPDPSSVFNRDVELHCQHLLPLAAIDLAHIDPQLKGWVHFIQPIEPYDGVVGEGGDEHFNYYCRENYVGYQYDDSGRCSLATGFQFFQFARHPDSLSLAAHYRNVRTGFSRAREHFQAHGRLHRLNARPPFTHTDSLDLIRVIGRPSEGGNWTVTGKFPLHWESTEIDGEEGFHVVPVTDDGRPFVFVGKIAAYHWILSKYSVLGCDLLLFFDPVSRISLTTFDWS